MHVHFIPCKLSSLLPVYHGWGNTDLVKHAHCTNWEAEAHRKGSPILQMRELNPREKMCFIQHHTAATSQSRVRNDHYSPRSLPMPLKLHQASKGTALVTPSPPYETSAHLWLTTPTLSHHFIYASGCVCVCPNFGCV